MNLNLDISNDNVSDAGLYTWDLGTDMLYADSALAELFGLDKAESEHGLPLTRYVERVHIEDRPMLAGAIRQAILTGQPFQESYRVHKSNGDAVRILAFGRCFRDGQGMPRFYAGIVFPMPQEQATDDGLLWQCLSALEAAKREGRHDVAAAIAVAIGKLDPEVRPATIRLAS